MVAAASQYQPLYETFVRPVEKLMGLNARQFSFENDGVALNQDWQVALVGLTYLLIVFQLPRMIQGWQRSPARYSVLNFMFLVHNTLLSAGSLLLLALIAENLVPRTLQHGLQWSFCSRDSFEGDGRLQLYYYINYLFKYYELIDTIFMIRKGKQVPFLHYFHHAMTMLLCYVQLKGHTSVSYVPITINLAVHVVMYYYYAITSIPPLVRREIWWKKHLTTMQIVQFVIDVVVINLALFWGYTHRYPHALHQLAAVLYTVTGGMVDWRGNIQRLMPSWEIFGRGTLPNDPVKLGGFVYQDKSGCYGSINAGIFGLAVINSYLLLFIKFFIDTYYGNKSPKSSAAAGASKSSGSSKKVSPSKKGQ